MSSSSQGFTLGGLEQTYLHPVTAGAGVVTPAPFAVAPTPDEPAGQFQPMTFLPFDGSGTIVSRHASEEPITDDVAETMAVEPEEPAPPAPDFEAIRAEAWREGFQLGYDEGLRLAAEEQRDTGTRISALLQGVTSDTETLVRGLETEVVELALAIAEKVIAREARIDPEIVLNVVRSALTEVHDSTELRIRVHPDDMPLLETRWQEMLPRSVAERSELVADDLVERGGVLVETRIGYADSQLKSRLSQIVTTFQAVLDGEPA
jgi:flagellar biosynthesis/type III secretory pathway protein FliH